MSALQWVTLGEPDVVAELAPRLRAACDAGARAGEWLTVGEYRGYLKHGPLHGKAGLRHALRTKLGLALPRLQEFENLGWLRANGFGAPRPLAAGGAFHGARPVFQYLFTEEVAAPTLREVFARGPAPERVAILVEVGATLARLHARGFVHRDAFPRNLLVRAASERPRIVFLDAWRGGVRRGLRGPGYDLACLLLFAPELFTEAEQAALLGAYFAEARRAGLRFGTASLPAVARQRRALALRYARRRRGGPGQPPPVVWTPPGNLDPGSA